MPTDTTRRAFLKQSLFSSTALRFGGLLSLLPTHALANAPAFNDYKALVMINLGGGNDAFNTYIPIDSEDKRGYQEYQSIRGSLAIDNANLYYKRYFDGNRLSQNPYDALGNNSKGSYLRGSYPNATPLSFNAMMPEMAHLMDEGKLALVANVGLLVEPTTRDGIHNQTATLPSNLFSHNIQTDLLFAGDSNNHNAYGWAGRLADHWSGINNNSILGLNISYGGTQNPLIGQSSVPLSLSTSRVENYSGMRLGVAQDTARRELFEKLFALSHGDRFKDGYNTMIQKSSNLILTHTAISKTNTLHCFES